MTSVKSSAWTPDGCLLAFATVEHALLKRRPPIHVWSVTVHVCDQFGIDREVYVDEDEHRDAPARVAVAWGDTPDAQGRGVLAIVYGSRVILMAIQQQSSDDVWSTEELLTDSLALASDERITRIRLLNAQPQWAWELEASIACDPLSASRVTKLHFRPDAPTATSHTRQTLWISNHSAATAAFKADDQKLFWTTPCGSHLMPLTSPQPAVWATLQDGSVNMACLEPSTGKVVVSMSKSNTTTITTYETRITTGDQLWWVANNVFAVGEQQVDEYRVHAFVQVGATIRHSATHVSPGVRCIAPFGTKFAAIGNDLNIIICHLDLCGL